MQRKPKESKGRGSGSRRRGRPRWLWFGKGGRSRGGSRLPLGPSGTSTAPKTGTRTGRAAQPAPPPARLHHPAAPPPLAPPPSPPRPPSRPPTSRRCASCLGPTAGRPWSAWSGASLQRLPPLGSEQGRQGAGPVGTPSRLLLLLLLNQRPLLLLPLNAAICRLLRIPQRKRVRAKKRSRSSSSKRTSAAHRRSPGSESKAKEARERMGRSTKTPGATEDRRWAKQPRWRRPQRDRR